MLVFGKIIIIIGRWQGTTAAEMVFFIRPCINYF